MFGVWGGDERTAVSNVNGQSWRWFSLLILASPLDLHGCVLGRCGGYYTCSAV